MDDLIIFDSTDTYWYYIDYMIWHLSFSAKACPAIEGLLRLKLTAHSWLIKICTPVAVGSCLCSLGWETTHQDASYAYTFIAVVPVSSCICILYINTLTNFSALRSCPAWCAVASLKYGSRSRHALLHILHPQGQRVDRNNATINRDNMAMTFHKKSPHPLTKVIYWGHPDLPQAKHKTFPSALGCPHVFSRVVFNALVLTTPKGCRQNPPNQRREWRTIWKWGKDCSLQSERHGCRVLLWNIAK